LFCCPCFDIRANQSDEDEEEENEMAQFRFAKHRHGWFNRTFRTGEVIEEEKLLSYKKSMIKKSLLKKNRDLDEEATQAFKNIMSYMGDRSSSKEPLAHAKKLIFNAMNNPGGLRDEIYLQLCKQTTANPNLDSEMKGWELMNLCLASFPPSKQLRKFLAKYFQQVAETEESHESVQEFALECLKKLPKIIALGQRKFVPSSEEFKYLKQRAEVPVRIYLVDGTFKTLMVDSYTFARDVENLLFQKFNLTLQTPFALYEADANTPNVERLLEPKERVLDVMSSWEIHAEEAKAADTKQQTPNPEVPKVEAAYQFLFKAKLVLKTSDPDVMADPEAVSLLYLQATHDIVTSRYPVKEKDVTVLAALQLQATYGDFQPDSHVAGWLFTKLEQFMPKELLLDKKGKVVPTAAHEWEQKILEKYEKINGFTNLEAKLNYLDYVQNWAFYGSTFFSVEQRQFKDYPSPLLCGISCEGVILMHPKKRVRNLIYMNMNCRYK